MAFLSILSVAVGVIRDEMGGGHEGHEGHEGMHDGMNATASSGGESNTTDASMMAMMQNPRMMEMMMDMMDNMRGRMMTVYAQKTNFFLLFRSLFISSTGDFVGALIAVFLFAMLATMVIETVKLMEFNSRYNSRKTGLLGISAASHAIGLFFHYTAMLLVMSMNVWIFIAILLGHGVGWFVFAMLERKVPFIRSLRGKERLAYKGDPKVVDGDSGTSATAGAPAACACNGP